MYKVVGSKGYSFMLALFTCEIFSKWYREMDTICFPAVLLWQEPSGTLYGNEFCLSLIKTLLPQKGLRTEEWVSTLGLLFFPHSNVWLSFRLKVKSMLSSLRLDHWGKNILAVRNGLLNRFSWEYSNILLSNILIWEGQFYICAKDKTQFVYFS